MEIITQYPLNLLLILAIAFGALGILYLFSAIAALRRLRLMKVSTRLLFSLIFLPLALISSGILLGTHGYHKLTYEEPIADIKVTPLSQQLFQAIVTLPNGDIRTYRLEGDQIQIDANIIKWKPVANLLGLHTHYQLNRISGRYRSIEDAQQKPASTFELSEKPWLDLVEIRQDYKTLDWLLDAEYGSATFVSAEHPKSYQLLVSTSGLLIREKEPVITKKSR